MTSTTVKVSPSQFFIFFEMFTPGQTKAKRRYLRAKKERKRHRRAAAPRSAPAGGTGGRDDGEDDDDDDEGEEGRASEPDVGSEIVVDVDGKGAQSEHEKTAAQRQARKEKHREKGKNEASTVTPAEEGDASRPRKRRKLDRSGPRPGPDPSRSPAAAVYSSPSATSSPVSGSPEPQNDPPTLDHHARTPTPLPSLLPRFPLPSRPRAPEKFELASQGLDRSLACAQLVDPLLTTPLSLDEDGGDVAGLSTRMIRRLRDLGMIELFAGAYRLASQENT
jgi:ATP-dependent RNA helicase DDX51/DBP6